MLTRKSIFSLKSRMENSANAICAAAIRSEVRVYSPIWKNFDIKLRGQEVPLF